MSYDLDWVSEVILDPVTEPEAPGQISLELVSPSEFTPCACGGMVYVEDNDVAEGVARHTVSGRHQEWRLMGGLRLSVDPEKRGRQELMEFSMPVKCKK